jgi:His/Glu/Gln/Arg/opine family amino acid ABC transporter permease subunit
MSFDGALAWAIIPRLLQGLAISIAVLLPSLCFGALIALPVALARRSAHGLVGRSARLATVFFQGVPLLVLLYFIYNGLARVDLVRHSFLWFFFSQPYYCALLACSINHAAFVSEIIFGGLKVIPSGLIEAGRSLGLKRTAILWTIELPLGARYALSGYRNEVVLFFKGTAVVGAVTLYDLLRVARQVVDTTFDPFTPFVMAAIFYWSCVQLMQFMFDGIEKYLNRAGQMI